jgi:hypothetical protein
MTTIKWNRYPLIAKCTNSKIWLKSQADLKLAQNTIEAYGRALEDFFRVCAQLVGFEPERLVQQCRTDRSEGNRRRDSHLRQQRLPNDGRKPAKAPQFETNLTISPVNIRNPVNVINVIPRKSSGYSCQHLEEVNENQALSAPTTTRFSHFRTGAETSSN